MGAAAQSFLHCFLVFLHPVPPFELHVSKLVTHVASQSAKTVHGDGDAGGGDGGGGDGARRRTETWTSATEGAAGASSMVTPNALLILARGLVCKATAAVSTGLVSPALVAVVSVTTTVRMTLPAVAVTVSRHAGRKH